MWMRGSRNQDRVGLTGRTGCLSILKAFFLLSIVCRTLLLVGHKTPRGLVRKEQKAIVEFGTSVDRTPVGGMVLQPLHVVYHKHNDLFLKAT